MAEDRKATLSLAELVEDYDLYPRHSVDEAHVSQLYQALQAGAQLPPIIVEAASKRMVDGWHRARAWKKHLGPTAVVDVILREYATESDLLSDSVRLNAAHGRPLGTLDQVRIVAMCQHRGMEIPVIARIMNVTEPKVHRLQIRVATYEGSDGGAVPGTKIVPLKRPAIHLAGQTLTQDQAKAHLSAPGTSYLFVVRQLREGLKSGLVNRADVRIVQELGFLEADIRAFLAKAPA